MANILRGWGLDVLAVSSGETVVKESLRAMQESRPFRLVLLDRMLPLQDGFEVAERLKAANATEDVLVLMVSNLVNSEDLEQYRESGIDRNLSKPVVQSELLDAILQSLGTAEFEGNCAASSDAHSKSGLKILVAEDGLVNQRVAKGLIEQLGHTPVLAENGQVAVQKWQCRSGGKMSLM